MVLLAVDCIGWLFCVFKRRNVTEPRDRWGLYGLWQARDPCARSLATSPHDQDTEQPIQTTGPGIWRKISSARQKVEDLNSRSCSRIKIDAKIHCGLPSCASPKARRSNREIAWCVTSLYTRRRTREPKSGRKRRGKTARGGKDGQGRKRRSGEENNPGEETTPKEMPARAADTHPV